MEDLLQQFWLNLRLDGFPHVKPHGHNTRMFLLNKSERASHEAVEIGWVFFCHFKAVKLHLLVQGDVERLGRLKQDSVNLLFLAHLILVT